MSAQLDRHVDLFDNAYANFTKSVLAAVRTAAFGVDLGQNSWVTADEYGRFIEWLKLTSGSGGPALHLATECACRVTGIAYVVEK